jgi:hypothetical protein
MAATRCCSCGDESCCKAVSLRVGWPFICVVASVLSARLPYIALLNIVCEGIMRNDPWKHVLGVLAGVSRGRVSADGDTLCLGYAAYEAGCPIVQKAAKEVAKQASRQSAKPACRNLCDGYTEPRVNIIERISATRLVVCWCDATSGRYGEQSWKLCAARNGAVCALSGARIRRGDKVYRPWSRGQKKPVNANQSILASAVTDV